ncbi:FAD binding domain-containing protein [Maricurvus nonylphenolicus]|uniref:FAD binding domain-containing protein n=1 Tax=Maricurvus nonylphenolicus TaxID=1008307 RepID=UPI0036F19EF4
MKPLTVNNVTSIDEAATALSQGNTKVVAGGTDLISGLKKNIYRDSPATLINLKTVEGLNTITMDGDILKIGATTTVEEIANSPLVKDGFNVLAQAAAQTASPLLRYSGTIAGNICQDVRCWYFRAEDNYFDCIMKGGDTCYALRGDNRNHSVMGSINVNPSACSSGCPTGVNVAYYMAKIREDNFDEAAEILLQTNAMPAITGRACPHTCQDVCSRKAHDEEIGIRSVERMLGDRVLDNPQQFMTVTAADTGKHMAVVGSGPAGLAAAYYLRKAGNQVTVYEQFEKPGGLLRYGLPDYRIPADVIDKQIHAYEVMGINFKCNMTLGSDISVEDLSRDHDAVFLGTGAWKERMMRIEGEDECVSGIQFLKELSEGKQKRIAGRVLVIGGGNVGVDVATTLKRMGAEPLVVDRLARDQIAVIEHELHTAIDEGVEFDYLTMPVGITRKGDKLEVRFVKMQRADSDSSGRPNVTPIEGSEFTMEVTAVMKSIGEIADIAMLNDELTQAYNHHQGTQAPAALNNNVYAGGDFISGPTTVVTALGAGRRGAELIVKQHCKSSTVELTPAEPIKIFEPSILEGTKPMLKEAERTLEQKRAEPMGEDFAGLNQTQAKEEASRCMSCGCISASPSDLAPALLTLNATIITTERTLTAAEFAQPGKGKNNSLRDGELITEIHITKPEANSQQYQKFRARGSIDFPVVSLASAIDVENGVVKSAQLGLGAVAPLPLRAEKAEAFLLGKEITETVALEAAELAMAGARPSRYNAHKVQIAKAFVKQAILDANN